MVNNLMNGLVEFICYVFLPAFIDIRCIGRKYGVVITMAIGSIGCFLAAAFGELSRNEVEDENLAETYDLCMKIFAIVGKFGVSGTFGVIYVHASELYPTPIRSIGKSLCVLFILTVDCALKLLIVTQVSVWLQPPVESVAFWHR